MFRSMATLKERLTNWHDWDTAAYEVGVCLGFWSDLGAPAGNDPWNGTKHIFWSDDPLGNVLYMFLTGLVETGMLEMSEDRLSFRWNPNYQSILP